MAKSFDTLQQTIRQWLITSFEQVRNILFISPERKLPIVTIVFYIVFYIALYGYGAWQWNFFYSRGDIPFDFADWAEVTGPRYSLLNDAADSGQFPLHASNTATLRGVTDRYFSIADTPISPEYLLLRWLEPGPFLFVDTLLWYTAGYIGLLLFARRYHLAPFTFSLFFFLLDFNGYITAHLAVGHSYWTIFFLLPFFVMLCLDLVEKQVFSWRWVLKLSLFELVILLQGGMHLLTWSMLFLGALALFNVRLIKPVLLGALFTGLVCLPRLLPPMLVLEDITQEYLGGFPSLNDLFASLVTLRHPTQALQALNDTLPLNGWEVDFYIGQVGFWLLAVFGIFLPLRAEQFKKTSPQIQVLFASLVVALLSIGEIYAWLVRVVTLPPLTGERVTSRMLIVPLVMVLALAVTELQKWLNARRFAGWGNGVLLALAALLVHDLFQHLQVWRIRYLDQMIDQFPKVPFDPANHTLANHPDTLYVGLMLGGAVVAVAALGFLITKARRA